MNLPAENVIGAVSPLPPQSETTAVISMLERIARDPSVPMDRLERAWQMRKEIQMEAAEEAFNEAMSAVQGKMRAVAADANNPQTRSRYASYFALDKAIRPIYSAEGFGLSFDTEDSPAADHVRIVCYVTRGKFTRKYRVDMPADGKGAKGGDVMTKTHATGSAVSYGMRYLLKMIFNIAVSDRDDDGNAAARTGGGVITAEQAKEIKAKCDQVADGFDESFCNYFGIEAIADLPAKDYQRALAALKKKGV
jgi:hypothetical protein